MPNFKPTLSKIIPIINNKDNDNKAQTNENCSVSTEYEVSDVDISEISGSQRLSINQPEFKNLTIKNFPKLCPMLPSVPQLTKLFTCTVMVHKVTLSLTNQLSASTNRNQPDSRSKAIIINQEFQGGLFHCLTILTLTFLRVALI